MAIAPYHSGNQDPKNVALANMFENLIDAYIMQLYLEQKGDGVDRIAFVIPTTETNVPRRVEQLLESRYAHAGWAVVRMMHYEDFTHGWVMGVTLHAPDSFYGKGDIKYPNLGLMSY